MLEAQPDRQTGIHFGGVRFGRAEAAATSPMAISSQMML
jgi:hypothetical protein